MASKLGGIVGSVPVNDATDAGFVPCLREQGAGQQSAGEVKDRLPSARTAGEDEVNNNDEDDDYGNSRPENRFPPWG